MTTVATNTDGTSVRLEIAQIVWHRALELDGPDDTAAALELARLARHDRAVLQHAISHGRTRQDDGPTELRVAHALAELEAAIALVKPSGLEPYATTF